MGVNGPPPGRLTDHADREQDVYVIILQNGIEFWAFTYRDSTRRQLLRQLGKMAADPKLKFNWWDCALVSKRVRETAE